MNSPLEHNSQSAYLIGQLVAVSGHTVPKGSVVTVCAWCDPDKTITNIVKGFYTVSHGICKACMGKVTVPQSKRPITDSSDEEQHPDPLAETMTDEEHAEYSLARNRQIKYQGL